jgi:alkanesulfonate monooxygenase SsuD/methylene tetrahydromethanopterin reductase-like flavin-dependent oxidoreductase (luciferase family)
MASCLFFGRADRVKKSKEWIDRGRARASGLGKVDVTLGLPTFVGDDVKAMRDAAREPRPVYDLPVLQAAIPRGRFRPRGRSDGEGRGRAIAQQPAL